MQQPVKGINKPTLPWRKPPLQEDNQNKKQIFTAHNKFLKNPALWKHIKNLMLCLWEPLFQVMTIAHDIFNIDLSITTTLYHFKK